MWIIMHRYLTRLYPKIPAQLFSWPFIFYFLSCQILSWTRLKFSVQFFFFFQKSNTGVGDKTQQLKKKKSVALAEKSSSVLRIKYTAGCLCRACQRDTLLRMLTERYFGRLHGILHLQAHWPDFHIPTIRTHLTIFKYFSSRLLGT